MTDIPEDLGGDPRRRASAAVRGFQYQFWRTVEAWIDLGPEEVLFVEGAEDFDRIRASGPVVGFTVTRVPVLTRLTADVEGAEEDLQACEDVGERHAERLGLGAVHLSVKLRDARPERGERRGDLGPLARCIDDLPRSSVQVLERAAGHAVNLKLEPTPGADAPDRRWRKDNDDSVLDPAELCAQPDGVRLQLRRLSFGPGREAGEERADIRFAPCLKGWRPEGDYCGRVPDRGVPARHLVSERALLRGSDARKATRPG